jgi:hypothetical protein
MDRAGPGTTPATEPVPRPGRRPHRPPALPAGAALREASPLRASGARPGRPEAIAVALTIAFGLAVRIWMLRHPIGTLDSDEAVVGLMARNLLHGHATTFFWGQTYGSPVEAVLAAGVFAVAGSSVPGLKAVPLALSAGAAALVWRTGRRLFSPAAGRWAGALLWIWPPAFVWWSIKAGVYWGSLCLALGVLLGLCRLADHQASAEARTTLAEVAEFAGLGLVTGLAWWANPQTLYLIAPAAVWFSVTLLRRWAYLPVLAAGALAGAAPWLRYNLIHRWASFTSFAPQPSVAGGYLGRVHAFFQTALPMALGLRVPYTGAWLLGAAGRVGYGLVLGAFALWLVVTAASACRRGANRAIRSGLFLGLAALAYPLLFAVSPFSWYVNFPRYLLFLAPIIALLAGWGAGRRWLWLPALAAAVALTLAGVSALARPGVTAPYAPDVRVPASLGPLQGLLARYRVRDAFADYWLAYRTTFETGERTLVDPTYVARDPGIDAAVRASPDPAYLFVSRSVTVARFQAACARLGVPLALYRAGPFTLAVPGRKVLPEQLGAIWQP